MENSNNIFGNISKSYNPDVLTCLANLSNDEVFTPPELVNRMLDSLPIELWSNKDIRFLDPVTKSGVFLREIAKRLNDGLKDVIQDQEQRLNHIFTKQIFGIAITELTSLLARRSVYCSKKANSNYSICSEFKNSEGNIIFHHMKHTWDSGKCKYCGATKEVYDRDDLLESYAYDFIHVDEPQKLFGNEMKFDVIIGNPPYQLSDGGNGVSAIPIFHHFVRQAKKLNPRYLSMIIPARWYAGGKGLDEFRVEMLNDRKIKFLVDFDSSKDCFEGVNIAGGICYFLRQSDHEGDCEVINYSKTESNTAIRALNEFPIFIRANKAISIIHKVLSTSKTSLETIVYPRNPFGFVTKDRGQLESFKDSVRLLSSDGFGYVSRDAVARNKLIIDQYKIIIGRLVPSNGELDVNPKDGYRVITNTRILQPGEITTESYLVIGAFETESEANNFNTFIKLKFPRFLLRQSISSVNVTKECFKLIPLVDFKETWTDEKLYKKYNLTQDEIDFIESTIRLVD